MLTYIIHMRPRSWAIVAGHMTVGFAVAFGNNIISGSLATGDWLRFAGALIIWTVFLNGGTLALNTAHDKDEGDIGYLSNPPPIPRHLSNFGTLILTAGLVLSTMVGWKFMAIYAVCYCMSILYSVPPIRLKSRAGFDVLINSTGYGMLTFLAGFAASNLPIQLHAWIAGAGYFLLFTGFYPLTQLYQNEEDMRHGDITLSGALGRKRVLSLALGAVIAAFTAMAIHVWFAGLGTRTLILLGAFLAWMAVIIPWRLRTERYPEKKGMYRALKAWGLTDLAIAINAIFLF